MNNAKKCLSLEIKIVMKFAHFYLHTIYRVHVWGPMLLEGERTKFLK